MKSYLLHKVSGSRGRIGNWAEMGLREDSTLVLEDIKIIHVVQYIT
jgi:hypothetical protein